jgi:Tol biopolymer transport system component
LPFPTDTMLVRSDTYSGQPPQRTSGISLLTPGGERRTSIIDTGGDAVPQWSHDRTQIADTRIVGDDHEIWVLKADGTGAHKVVSGVTYVRASWSADDTKLAYVKEVGGVPQIFTVALGSGAIRQVTHAVGVKGDPVWSPDGKSLAYWVRIDDVRQIYLLDLADPVEPGRQLTRGADGPGVDPAWSPDGKLIVYTRGTGTGKSDIWVMKSDGSSAHAVATDPAREMDPSFAPDGNWVAFVRGDLDKPKVVIVKVDGTQERTLTPAGKYEGLPCWS